MRNFLDNHYYARIAHNEHATAYTLVHEDDMIMLPATVVLEPIDDEAKERYSKLWEKKGYDIQESAIAAEAVLGCVNRKFYMRPPEGGTHYAICYIDNYFYTTVDIDKIDPTIAHNLRRHSYIVGVVVKFNSYRFRLAAQETAFGQSNHVRLQRALDKIHSTTSYVVHKSERFTEPWEKTDAAKHVLAQHGYVYDYTPQFSILNNPTFGINCAIDVGAKLVKDEERARKILEECREPHFTEPPIADRFLHLR